MSENEKIESHVLDKYEIMKKLGSGAYGHVWKVKNRENSQFYALKKIFDAFQHATDSQRTFREISILKKLNHPNIVKLHEVLESQTKRDIYLVFQFMQTDLCNAIYDNILHKVHQKYIIYQILLALVYLHSARVIHRDLKPSNIILKGDCSMKLCDFGLVRFIGDTISQSVMTEGVATRWYRAPEVLLGSNCYNQATDLWSVGCIIGEMVSHNPLFAGNSTIEQLEKILQFTGKPSQGDIASIKCQLAEPMINNAHVKVKSKKQYFNSNVDPDCIKLICSLIEFNPLKRITALEALKSPFLKQFYEPTDIKTFQGEIKLEVSDNSQLQIQQYKALIHEHFINHSIIRKNSMKKNIPSNSLKKFTAIRNNSGEKGENGEIGEKGEKGEKITQYQKQLNQKALDKTQERIKQISGNKSSSRFSQNERAKRYYENTSNLINQNKDSKDTVQPNLFEELINQNRSKSKNRVSPSFNSLLANKIGQQSANSLLKINEVRRISKQKENVSSNLAQGKFLDKKTVNNFNSNVATFAGLKKVSKNNR